MIILLFCRPETKLWSPSVTEQNKSHPFKINIEAERQVCVFIFCVWHPSVSCGLMWSNAYNFTWQEYRPIGTAHNRKASPMVAAANINETRQVVSPTYNSPIGLYSSGNIQDALQGQLKGLIHSKPERWMFSTSYLIQNSNQLMIRTLGIFLLSGITARLSLFIEI